MYVKQANMEEKLFQNPPSATPSRVSSRAHRTKHTQEPSGNTHKSVYVKLTVTNQVLLIGYQVSVVKCYVSIP